jgi:hypothetical protein
MQHDILLQVLSFHKTLVRTFWDYPYLGKNYGERGKANLWACSDSVVQLRTGRGRTTIC